jgi:hypothetical protein
MRLPALYHWSPRANRNDIRDHGLKPYASMRGAPEEQWAMGCGCICLAAEPSQAWRLSGDIDGASPDTEEWDLWEVRLADTDEVHVRAEFGQDIKEIRVMNTIPADRLWWVGVRK